MSKMLIIPLFLSAAMALEIGISSNATDPSSTTTISVTNPSVTSTVLVELSLVSSSSAASSTDTTAVTTPTITSAATLPTPPCDSNNGRDCSRLPEQPYWNEIYSESPSFLFTNLYYGNSPTAYDDPWKYYWETRTTYPSAEASSVSSCQARFYSSLSDYFASAPIISGAYIPPSSVVTTVTPYTSTEIDMTAISTGTTTETLTRDNFDATSTSISTYTTTETDHTFWSTTTFTETNTASGVTTIQYAGYPAYFYESEFAFAPTSTCCSACTLFGGSIEVMYWAPATSGAPSTTVSSGFTFTSPSIYVALQTLSATDLCGEVGSEILTGTTLAFPSGQLSTAIAYSSNSSAHLWDTQSWTPPWEKGEFGSVSCTSITTTFWISGEETLTYSATTYETEAASTVTFTNTGVVTTYTYPEYTRSDDFAEYVLTYNPCFPNLSVPPEVLSVDELWTKCSTGYGFQLHDPPYVLSHAAGLGGFGTSSTSAPVTSPEPIVTSTSSADPGSTPPSVTPTATNNPPANPTTTTTNPVVDPVSSATTSPTSVDPGNPVSVPQLGDTTSPDPATGETTTPIVADPGTPTSDLPSHVAGETTTPVAVDLGTPSNSPGAADPGTLSSSAQAVSAGNPATTNQASGNQPDPIVSIKPADPSTPAVATIGGQTVTANSASGFVIGSQTLLPGSQITLSGTSISLAANAATIVVGTSTQPLVAYTYVIGSQTLSPGGAAVTVSGTAYSLDPGASSVVVGGTTQPLTVVFGSSITPESPTYVIGSQTLSPGAPAITVSGTAYSLDSSASSVVIGGATTEALTALLGSSSTGLGGIIATVGGFGTSSTLQSTATPGLNGTTFEGAADRNLRTSWLSSLGAVIGSIVIQYIY